MNKSVKAWLETIPSREHRERALKNMFWERKDKLCESRSVALWLAFNWIQSPEKFKYWKAYQAVLIAIETGTPADANDIAQPLPPVAAVAEQIKLF